MNTCEEYREAIAADPSFDGGAGHLAACASCQTFRDEMQALDLQIARALSLSVPKFELPELPELPEMDSSNVTALPRRRFTTPTWLAIAASVTVAVVIGFQMFDEVLPTNETLAEQIVEHLSHEPFSLQVTDEAISDSRLDRVIRADIAVMDHGAGLITYAQSCTINGREVPHLVIQGLNGPVTILLMPEEMVEAAEEFGDETIDGIIIPVGKGSIAIIGEHGENLQRIQERVKNSVTWDI